MKIALFIISFIFSTPLYAESAWYNQRQQGWHFYDDPIQRKPTAKNAESKSSPLAVSPPNPELEADPLKWSEAMRNKGEWLKSKALREGGEENIKAYIEYQNQTADKANYFAENWGHVLRKNAELDYAVQNPGVQFGRHLFLDQQQETVKTNIAAFSQRYGLLFFFSSTCGYCKAQAPIVIQVANRYGLALLGVSLDGNSISGINDVEIDNGIAQRLNITATPAIVAVDHVNNSTIPIHTGLISGDDLAKLISEIVNYEKIS